MEKLEVHVANVKCGGCISAIKEGLSALPGIASIEVDIAGGKVSIEGSALDSTAIHNKLGELGYPVSD